MWSKRNNRRAEYVEIRRVETRAQPGFHSNEPVEHFIVAGTTIAAHDLNEILFERDWSLPVAFHANSLTQVVQRSGSKQLALRDDRDVAAQAFDDLQHVRSQEHRQASRCESQQQVLQGATHSERLDGVPDFARAGD